MSVTGPASFSQSALRPLAAEWPSDLYDTLLAQVPSPTVALNRAIAVAMSTGAAAGLTGGARRSGRPDEAGRTRGAAPRTERASGGSRPFWSSGGSDTGARTAPARSGGDAGGRRASRPQG